MTIDTKKLNHDQAFMLLCDDAKCRIEEISADDVQQKFNNGEEFCLIDVREADEFSNFHIDGAQHLSKGWAEAKIHTVVSDKDEEIVLYCGSDKRSALVADNLKKMGYSNVKSMAGGIKGWIDAGKPVNKA